MNQDQKKQKAALAAMDYVKHSRIIGVGTGSTVNFFISCLDSISSNIDGAVSSSEASTMLLKDLGIPVLDANEVGSLDVYVDGADEANKHLQLIKGGGGALTREKIIAELAQKFVCIVDDSKIVQNLGKFPLPVEVIPMARSMVARKLVGLGGQPEYRQDFVTDNGNHILDVHNLKIRDAVALEREINQIPGVVTVGLFANRAADVLIIADDADIKTMTR